MTSKATKVTVELFYDVVSPYSWLAFEILCRYRQKWTSMNLVFKPMFLGGVMAGADNRPPGMVARKAAYGIKDITWLGKHYGIPFQFPDNPEQNVWAASASLPPMRFLTALHMKYPELTESVSRVLWMRLWSRGQLINQPEYLREVAIEAGLSSAISADLLQEMNTPHVKDRLKEVTQEALDHGAFGSPIIVTTDKNNKKCMLFGADRIPILADIIGEKYEGPLLQYNKCKL